MSFDQQNKSLSLETQILHADRFSNQMGAVHAPVHPSVAFGYSDTQSLVNVFQGKTEGYTYSRQNNPTLASLQKKITLFEAGQETLLFSTGMAAITAIILSLLKLGDHMIASKFLFGNTISLFNTFAKQGIEVTYVDPTNFEEVVAAYKTNTRLFFIETIANPKTQIADLAKIGEFCQAKNCLYIIDNTVTTPITFQPKRVQANLSVHSLTKYIGGQANVLGGSVTDLGTFDWEKYPNISKEYRKGDSAKWGIKQIKKKALRDAGAALTAESAHKIAIGLETLHLRVSLQNKNATQIATFMQGNNLVKKVYHPSLSSHPQHKLCKQLFSDYGNIVSFELRETIDPIAFCDSLKVIIASTNIGDNRTLIIPVSQTIYWEIGKDMRRDLGISDNLLRLSIGIESLEDLIQDLSAALDLHT